MENLSDLRHHLASEHRQSPFAEYLKEIVYGGVDGIVTTFAVVAGFSGAQMGNEVLIGISIAAVLLFGFANLFADGVSMALGNFLSTRAEQDVYRQNKNKEQKEINEHPENEAAETMIILQDKGFSKEDALALTELYKKNPNYWLQWMMDHELEMSNPEGIKASLTALATFSSFIFFGAIPLLPYLTSNLNPTSLFQRSIIGTFVALLLLGILKGRVIEGGFRNKRIIRSVIEIVAIGSVSAIVAFLVGTFFK